MEKKVEAQKIIPEKILFSLGSMSLGEFMTLFPKLDDFCLKEIVYSIQIHHVTNEILLAFFLRIPIGYKKVLLQHEDLYCQLMDLVPNVRRKSILEVVDVDTLQLIITSTYSEHYISKIHSFFKKQSIDQFEKYCNSLNLFSFYNNYTIIGDIPLLRERMNVQYCNSMYVDLFLHKVSQGILNPVGLVKISNEKELLIYTRFGLLTSVLNDMDEITFSDGLVLSYTLLSKINEKHVQKLIFALQKRIN